jgi:hypothetical protein
LFKRRTVFLGSRLWSLREVGLHSRFQARNPGCFCAQPSGHSDSSACEQERSGGRSSVPRGQDQYMPYEGVGQVGLRFIGHKRGCGAVVVADAGLAV